MGYNPSPLPHPNSLYPSSPVEDGVSLWKLQLDVLGFVSEKSRVQGIVDQVTHTLPSLSPHHQLKLPPKYP